jgi:nitroreductase
MDVIDAVLKRRSVRAFRPDPVDGAVVRALLETAARAPSGGNLQPWRVHALAGEPLAELKALAMARWEIGAEASQYVVYPPNLWDPFRGHRFAAGEDLYATIGIGRDDRPARLRQLARNVAFFDAPVGLFFSFDRNLGPPQWADIGMYMQTLMLLAVEAGLDTCAQEFWSQLPETVGGFLGLDDDHLLFAGMALGYRDDDAPINSLRTRRAPFEAFAQMRGF